MIHAVLFLLAITAAEVITIFLNPVIGIICHIIVIIALIISTIMARFPEKQAFYLALTLAPLTRVISLSIPLAGIPQIWWYPVVYTPLFGAGLMIMRILGYKPQEIGLSSRFTIIQIGIALTGLVIGSLGYYVLSSNPDIAETGWTKIWPPVVLFVMIAIFGAGFVLKRIPGKNLKGTGFKVKSISLQTLIAFMGFLIGLLEYFILRPEPVVEEFAWQTLWMPAIIFILTTGFVEEFLFRGIMQRSTMAVYRWGGMVYISVIFALLHLGFRSWIDVGFVLAVALFFGWAVKRTGSLLGVTLSHGFANITLYLIAPLLLG